MESIGPLLPAERKAKRADAARIKHLIGIFTAVSYAMLGGALWEPLFAGSPFRPAHSLAAVSAVAMLSATVDLAPKGEFDDKL